MFYLSVSWAVHRLDPAKSFLQEKDRSKCLIDIIEDNAIEYPEHSSIPKALSDLKEYVRDHENTMFLGRTILTETVLVLALKVHSEAQSLQNTDGKAKAVEKAKNIIRDEVTNVTNRLDGVTSADVQPALWDVATKLLG